MAVLDRLGERLRRRLATLSKGTRDAQRALVKVELGLNAEQFDAYLTAMHGRNLYLTGSAGVGKSHTLRHIVAGLKRVHGDRGVLVTGSTGAAAALIQGCTIHATMNIGLANQEPAYYVRRMQSARQKCMPSMLETCRRLCGARVLIIDEISMLDARVLEIVHRVCCTACLRGGGPGSSGYRPFGGLQLVACGDVMQLPAVNFASNGWFFEAPVWCGLRDAAELRTVELRECHRQSDTGFVQCLKRIRVRTKAMFLTNALEAHRARSDLRYLQQHAAREPLSGAIKLFAVNKPAEDENNRRLASIPGTRHVFEGVDSCDLRAHRAEVAMEPEERLSLFHHCPALKTLLLKEGCRVVCLKNMHSRCAGSMTVNGSLGTVRKVLVKDEPSGADSGAQQVRRDVQVQVVVDFDNGESHAFVTGNGHHIRSPPHENVFDQYMGDRLICSRTQLPLRLAYAISIHKSQGMSLDAVSVDLSDTFASGQAYVALSRAKELAKLHITGLKATHLAMANENAQAFCTSGRGRVGA